MFSKHGTLVDASVIDYITKRSDSKDYLNKIESGFTQLPLFVTVDDIKKLEMDLGLAKEDGSVPLAETKEMKVPATPTPAPEPAPTPQAPAPALKAPEPKPSPPPVTPTPQPPPPQPSLLVKPPKPQPSKLFPSDTTNGIRSSLGTSWRPIAAEYEPEFVLHKDITGDSTCEGLLTDFTTYFNSRFKDVKRLLRLGRSNMGEAVNIDRLKGLTGKVTTIGMVNSVSTTKNGHRMLNIEDDTGEVRCLINKKSDNFNTVVVEDEVIGIIGSLSDDKTMLFIDELVRPEVPYNRIPNRAEVDLCAAFVSDIHIGSDTFLKENWEQFIKWLNGGSDSQALRDVASKVKYLILPGDLVDGIGVYPDQIKELDISDIEVQYEALSSELARIPDHIQIIAQPGNHDAVRLAEPQPSLPPQIQEIFDREVTFLGNPASFSVHGVDVLSYHGKSIDDFVMEFPHLSYENPIAGMKEMLLRRHLLPMYGMKTPIAPEHSDHLLIDKIPDIFATGHVHTTGVDDFRGVVMINASAWQSQTSFQKIMNFVPDPGKVPVVNLMTRDIKLMDFMTT